MPDVSLKLSIKGNITIFLLYLKVLCNSKK